MNRTHNRIKHDYRPLPLSHPRIKKFEWFVAGLALPFLVLSLALAMRDADGNQRKIVPRALPQIVDEPATADELVPLPEFGAPTAIETPPAPPEPDALTTTNSVLALLEHQAAFDQLDVVIKRGDSLDRLFKKHGLSRTDLANIMKLPEARNTLRILKPGDIIGISHEEGKIHALNRRVSETLSVSVNRDADGFKATMIAHPVEYRVAHAHGIIETSLFEAGQAAGISDKLLMNLAGIFAWDVDFVLDIRQGDEFTVLYHEIWQHGVRLRDGEIIAAEFINRGKSYRALRYEGAGGDSDYYTPDGRSVRKAFLRAPVDFKRISSNFNLRRRHPILNKIRAHKGVDYAAPTGTPVRAAGDGKVSFRGRKGGYGNTVILQHGGNITTLYGHLSKFAGTSRTGARVRQGQIVGYVGRTGLATGSHLHYEYRVNGVHRNPRTVKLPQAAPIPHEYKEDFLEKSGPLLARLDLVRRTQLAVGPIPDEE